MSLIKVSPLLLLTLLALAAAAPSADASSIAVTRYDDPPPDGCAPSDCSLREAVILMNNVPGEQTLRLPGGTFELDFGPWEKWYEDAGYLGDLDITDDVAITGNGPGSTIITQEQDRNMAPFVEPERAFDVLPTTRVTISGVAISNLNYVHWAPFDCGRGIRNRGELALSNVVISSNPMRGYGGGICNEGGALTVTDSTLSGNCACFAGGGGAIYNSGGTATLERVTVADNAADLLDGGAIYGGAVTARDSVFTGNHARGFNGCRRGGGIAASFVSLDNVTLSGNSTPDWQLMPPNCPNERAGGALYVWGSASLANVTVTGNESPTEGSGIFIAPGASAAVVNSIVAGNPGDDCGGVIDSEGFNIAGDQTCIFSGPADLNGIDPLLAPLADNGGPTVTHALADGSPAIDGASVVACPAADQRGFARPADGDGDGEPRCDVGAYESGSLPPPPTPTPSPSPPPTLAGDADCDGSVTPADALAALTSLAKIPPPAECLVAANLDCNLQVNEADVQAILRQLAGLSVAICAPAVRGVSPVALPP